MRHHWFSAAIPPMSLLAMSLLVSGCGPDSGEGNKFPNPAAGVSLSFDSFAVENEMGMPEVLPRTVFWDFYRGLEPADGADDQNTAAAIRERLDTLMGLTPSGDGTSYVAARNSTDFLNSVINSNIVNTFNDGRRLMRDSLAEGDPARYNTQANNATVRFTEDDGTGGEPGTDQIWVYPLVDWTSTPLTGKVLAARQFIARTPEDESETPPEVQSEVWSARFSGSSFAVSGYNQPEYELFSQTSRTLGNLELQKEYIGRKSDTFFLANPSVRSDATGPDAPKNTQCPNKPPEEPLDITIAGENPDCIRIEMDYPESTVRVYTSRNVAQFTDDCKAFRAGYCGNMSSSNGNDATVVYDSITIDSRQ